MRADWCNDSVLNLISGSTHGNQPRQQNANGFRISAGIRMSQDTKAFVSRVAAAPSVPGERDESITWTTFRQDIVDRAYRILSTVQSSAERRHIRAILIQSRQKSDQRLA